MYMHSMTLYVNINIYDYIIIQYLDLHMEMFFLISIMETIFLQVQPLPYSGVVSAKIW